MTLSGKRVLVTRPEHQSHEFARQLRAAGAEPILAPTITIGPPDDETPISEALDALRSYGWIVFTSRNGVDAFFARVAARGRDARILGDVRVAAIGPKTAHALERYGILADLTPERHVGEAVAQALLSRSRMRDRLLLFRAADANDALPMLLREGGHAVDDVAAYATHVVDDPDLGEKAARAEIVAFTSASTVAGFLHNIPGGAALLRAKTVACVGPVTADAARAAGITVDVVADTFTVDGLIAALAQRG